MAEFIFQAGTPTENQAPVVTGNEDTDGLLAIKSQLIALQFQATQQPKPDYNVHGHNYSWTQYQEYLVNSIAAVNRLLQAQDPFELVSRAIT